MIGILWKITIVLSAYIRFSNKVTFVINYQIDMNHKDAKIANVFYYNILCELCGLERSGR